MRKPRNFKLIENLELQAPYPGQKFFYLKTDAKTYYWIEGHGKLRRLIKWLQRLEKYQDSHD